MTLLARFTYPRSHAALDRIEAAVTSIREVLAEAESREQAADLDAGDGWLDPRYPASPERLPVPCWVKVAGGDDWLHYAGTDGFGRMVLFRDGCAAECFYEPTEGERFTWTDWL